MFAPGTRLGGYEITALIGVGGMGEVYRAHDPRLGRDVALKVLPQHCAADPERLARFQREAQVLAALNHPHIAAIYGFEEHDGVCALVLELVTGGTLADQLARGPLAPDAALPLAIQIADALETAHAHRIVHRDLKPSNIAVTSDGRVKVLDFGLAKLAFPEPAAGSAGSRSPTISSPAQMTRAGVMLGTAAYMSPEQVKGADVDERSDIWAFGAVLYEMLTGTRPFGGDSVAQVVARVLERDPDFAALPETTPPAVRRAIARCLRKNRERRPHHVADVRLELEDALAGDGGGEALAIRGSRPARRMALAWIASAAAAGVLGALLAAALIGPPAAPPAVVRSTLTVVPQDAGTAGLGPQGVAISADGQHVVYAAGGLYRRRLDEADPQPIRGGENGVWPAFSPDGDSVAFFVPSESAIKRVALEGGTAGTVTRTDGGLPRGLSWGPDGTIVFSTSSSRGLWRAPAAGGEAERLTTVVAGEAIAHTYPAVLPDGRGVLFAMFRGASSRVAVVALDTRQVRELLPSGSYPRMAPTGHLIYEWGGALWAAKFDTAGLELSGTSRVNVVNAVESGTAAISATGSLVYVPQAAIAPGSLVWIDRKGGEEPIDLQPRAYGTVRVSPDGRRIAASIVDAGNPAARSIWVSDLNRPGWRRITTPAGEEGDWFPMWAPDNERILFARYGSGPPRLLSTLADGTAKPELLLEIEDSVFLDPRAWSPDGQTLLFSFGDPTAVQTGLLSMAADDRGVRPWRTLVERAGGVWAGAISPDGRWILTESSDSGRREVYIERFPDLGGRQPVSVEPGGQNAVWSPDGRELFYRRNDDGAMMAVRIQTSPALSLGGPGSLYAVPPGLGRIAPSRTWDVAPDGRFLMINEAAPPSSQPREVRLVQNWGAELTRLVPAN